MKAVLKARRLAPLPRLTLAATAGSRQGTWRTGDLPAVQKAELGARLIQAERGEGLLFYDEAMAEVDRMVEEILAVVPVSSR